MVREAALPDRQAGIAGSAAQGRYSQTFTTGNFFIVLSLSGEDQVDMELGRNTLAKIEEMVFQTPAITPKEIVEILFDEFKNGIKLDLAIAKIEGPKLQLASAGDIFAKLIRQGKVVNLLTTQDNPEIKVVSGPVHQNDLFILGTTQFSTLLETNDLVANPEQTITELRDFLLPKVESLADNSKIAALLMRINLDEDTTEATGEIASDEKETHPEAVSNNRLAPVIAQLKSDVLSGRLFSRENKYLSKIGSPRGLYLKNAYGENAPFPQFRKTIYLALIVLIFLVSLVAFQLRSRAIEQSAKTIATMEKGVQDSLDSATKLSGVNDNIARDILLQSRRDFLSRAEASFGTDWQNKKTTETARLKTILASLDAKITLISHINNLSQLSVFYDFGLLKSGVKVVSSNLQKNEIIALDQVNGAIYTVGTKNKTATVVIGSDDLKSAKLVDGNSDAIFALKDSGIIKIDRSATTASAKQIINSSDKWSNIRGLRAFAGNLYLLDIANNQVWKYQGTDLGFSDIAPYLKSGGLDFSKVTAWAIDGYIYVLSGSGNVVRFASGYGDDSFKLAGLPDPLSSPTSIFASDETENIYILDGNKVIVTDKKGLYLSEYVMPDTGYKIQNAVSVLADESVKKVFLVSGDKVFSFDLK